MQGSEGAVDSVQGGSQVTAETEQDVQGAQGSADKAQVFQQYTVA